MPQQKKSLVKNRISAITCRIAEVIRTHHLISAGERILVAVSGGSDSLALLHLLSDIGIPSQLIAAYIDHGLRPEEIPREVACLKDCCRALDVPFTTRSIDVCGLMAREKRSPEEAARILRYQSLEELRIEYRAAAIAIGHTADDQVEEFFLRLIRGSSRRGLSGMAMKRDKIIRPLLGESKKNLIEYLTAREVSWCTDSSNHARQFLRNRVRLDLLPLLEEQFNPAIRRTVLQNMDIMAAEEDFLEELTEEAASGCMRPVMMEEAGEPRRLAVSTEPFLRCHPAIRRRLLEKCFLRMGIRPAYGQIETLVELTVHGRYGAELHLDDGVRIEKQADRLLFTRPLPPGCKRGSTPLLPEIDHTVTGPGVYTVCGYELIIEEVDKSTIPGDRPWEEPVDSNNAIRLVIDRDSVTFPLVLRSARPGETFHPCNGPGRKKISRFFNDRKIPARERTTWPVLVQDNCIVALAGLTIDHAFRATEQTTRLLAIQWRKKEGSVGLIDSCL